MFKQGLYQSQQQKLSPQQIQFIQLLQLSTTDIEKRIEDELTENPALETDSEGDDMDFENADLGTFNNEEPGTAERELPSGEALETSSIDIENSMDGDVDLNADPEADYEVYEVEMNDYVSEEDDPYGNDYSYDLPSDPNEENKEIPVATVDSLNELLLNQLGSLNLDEKKRKLGEHLIGSLEEDGYLRRPLRNIKNDLHFKNEMEVSEEELEEMLLVIQSFDPAGIGARSLEECLVLQLDRIEDDTNPLIPIARKLAEKYLTDLSKRHYDKLMQRLKIDRDTLKEVIEVITHLNPKPGESQVQVRQQYITPDFVVTRVDHELIVTLNSRNAPELRISKEFESAIKTYQKTKTKSSEQNNQIQFIKQKLDGAKWFIDALKQRQNTLLTTMNAIVEIQEKFFFSGNIEDLSPMILKDVAERIGMDISTVSRVANAKYVQCDHGIFSLKEFFSEGISTDSGEEVSNREVKQILLEYVEKEDKQDPLTDEKLTDLLNEKGYNIARRTVAKYREQLGIQVARLRKEI